MQKIYTRIYWQNKPSTSTALNETNLNKMDYALDQIDTRVVELAGYEERAEDAADAADEAKTAAISAKNDAVSAKNTAVSAKETAVSAKTDAQAAAQTATTQAGNASSSATAAAGSATAAAGSATSATGSATTATNKATEAETSATNANTNALKAEGYAVGKQNGTDVSSGSPYFHNNSKYFLDETRLSANTAVGAASDAQTYQYTSEAYAIGKRNGSDVPASDPAYHNNALYYAGVAEDEADRAKREADRAAQAAGFDPADYVHVNGDNLSAISATSADITAIINGTWTDT